MLENIEELFKHIKLRPQMYVGEEVTLERISLYISGFLASRYRRSGMNPIDFAFQNQFHQWVRNWALKNYGDEFDFPGGWGYVKHISQVCKGEEERVKIFFELAEKFFREMKRNKGEMEYDLQDLRKRVNDYFAGELSKKDLGVWCQKAHLDLLKGGYVEVRKIILYPFIQTLSQFHIESNDLADEYPCTEEEVKEIQSVLYGCKDFCYQMEMGIPACVYDMFPENSNFDVKKRDVFAEIRKEVLAYQEDTADRSFSESKLFEFIHSFALIKCEPETVQDMLEKEIWKLCMALFDRDSVKLERKRLTIMFPLEKEGDCGMEKLIEYLDCYLGNRSFNVVVSFVEGEPEVALLV